MSEKDFGPINGKIRVDFPERLRGKTGDFGSQTSVAGTEPALAVPDAAVQNALVTSVSENAIIGKESRDGLRKIRYLQILEGEDIARVHLSDGKQVDVMNGIRLGKRMKGVIGLISKSDKDEPVISEFVMPANLRIAQFLQIAQIGSDDNKRPFLLKTRALRVTAS